MKRFLLTVLLAAALGPACRTAGPPAPPGPAAPPDLLRGYVDQLLVLRHQGDEKTVRVKAQERLTGECDVAVYVRAGTFEGGSVRLSLETVGLPKVRGREPRCERTLPGMQLVVSGFPAAPEASAVASRLDELLQTPDAYLGAKGVAFDLAPGEAPREVASREVDASAAERALGRRVTAWPEPLLTVETWHHDVSGRVRQQSEVEMDAIVGADGRLYTPRVKTALGDAHERALVRVLPMWRFQPARRGQQPVAARVGLRPILRIY